MNSGVMAGRSGALKWSEDAIRSGEVQELREVVKKLERFTAFSPLFHRFGWGPSAGVVKNW
jgi:hypothetical protein